MFVLPPPTARYPPGAISENKPIVESNNLLENLAGAEFQLVVGEGTYHLRDSILLSTPPPHPSEAPVQTNNPLVTQIPPPTAGTKLSLAIIAPKHGSQVKFIRPETPGSVESGPSSGSNHEHDSSRSSNAGSLFRKTNAFGDGDENGQTPVFGQNNPALAVVNGKESKDGSKRRKPKSNLIKTNSSFVSRVIPHDSLAKRLAEHDPQGIFIFANINRGFQWLDLSATTGKQEYLTKILLTKAHALCHDINQLTKSQAHIDMVMGYSTGDIIWYEPISQKYSRINKKGILNQSAVTAIRWIPGSENLFLAAHEDGSLIVYDKEKEDAAFVADETVEQQQSGEPRRPSIQILKSVLSKTQKSNPVAYWKVSNQRINGFAFSPDGRHLAIVSEDGSLRTMDYHKETLLDQYMSYYGGLICVCWSPDGRYILTGGQDDLVSIWSLEDNMLVARCQGHSSWVTSVAFDPWRCDDRNYRFGSVGEDCRFLLWDFNVGMLHRPRAASVRQRASISSHPPGVVRNHSDILNARIRSDSNVSARSVDEDDVVHTVQPRARTAVLPPVMEKAVDDHPLCWLGFEEDCIITSCQEGHVRTWDRPKEGAGASTTNLA